MGIEAIPIRMPPQGSSIRLRLTMWNVGVLALVLVLLSGTLRYLALNQAMAALDSALSHRVHGPLSRWLSSEQAAPTETATKPNATNLPRNGVAAEKRIRSGSYSDSSMLRLFDLQGRPLLPGDHVEPWDRTSFLASRRGKHVYSTILVEEEKVRVYSAPLVRRSEVIGVVQTAEVMSDIDRGMTGLSSALMILAPLALLVAGLGGAFLTDRALGPVRSIAHATEQIGAINLSERLPLYGRDEFSRLTGTINGMLERLEKAFLYQENAIDQQRRFTADASHELRTPLTVIKANTSLVLSGHPSIEDYRRGLVAADHAADQMERIVQDLLLLARSDAGQLDFRLRPVPIVHVLETVQEMFWGREGAAMMVHIPDEPVCVMGEESHLVRLFTNLVENARRHTLSTGRIDLHVEPKGREVQIVVEDTGAGIAPQHLPYVCERFYRVEDSRSRNQGGSGLGLSICNCIAVAHGGSLSIASEPGVGTSVTVTLPLRSRSAH